MTDSTARPLSAPPRMAEDPAPIVVVGNGPVGMQAAHEILRRLPGTPLVIYGEECHPAYNRVRLSHLLAGRARWEEMPQIDPFPPGAPVEERLGVRVTAIHPQAHCVEDSEGRRQPYGRLILATGSAPRVPGIPGVELPGVFTFRNLDDALALLARQARSHRTVVLGGGLLGIEAARAMQRAGTRVTLIEHGDRLLGRQLDETASRVLEARLKALGLDLVIGDGVRRILGEVRVTGVEMHGGVVIPADTVILATGIRPRVELARQAGLAVGRGIRVDDAMRASAPDVYAVGECAEHRGRVYGLVAPGLEQAAVAASAIAGQVVHYPGSLTAARLKVADCPVFSSGPVGADGPPVAGRDHVYLDRRRGIYRRLLLRRWRLLGAVAVGPWDEDVRLQQAVARGQRVWPWQLWRFRRHGHLWPESEQTGVAAWPAAATVCQCTGVSRGAIDAAIARGADSVAAVGQATGAGSVCGTCRPLVQALLGAGRPEPEPAYRATTALALAAVLLALLILLAPPVPYPHSVQVEWRWDRLWRDGLLKQVSGYTVLGLFALGLLITPRKRLRRWQRLGSYTGWRLLHLGLGLAALATLLLHTGARLGHGLDFALMLSFSLLALLGGVAAALVGQGHRLGAAHALRLRRQGIWWHILLFWPVPVLLVFHVIKGYWF